MSLGPGRSIIGSMSHMNEAQVRTLDQVHQVLAGTQEMGFQAHNTLEKLFT
jgi:hypothetical protein